MIRSIAAASILSAIALLSGFNILLDVIAASKVLRDQNSGVPAFETRAAPLKAELPKSGVVGYFGTGFKDATEARAEYQLTQYALSPLVVKDSGDEDLVIANAHAPAGLQQFADAHRLEFVKTVGEHWILFRRKAP